ncbi:MAG: hypothetical protein NC407_01625 [Lachnoclostridium sp.]|nr:hypothetical protein [Lachnoclostridium sp.]
MIPNDTGVIPNHPGKIQNDTGVIQNHRGKIQNDAGEISEYRQLGGLEDGRERIVLRKI